MSDQSAKELRRREKRQQEWVLRRAACSIDSRFEAIKTAVTRDVCNINKLIENEELHYRLEPQGTASFCVVQPAKMRLIRQESAVVFHQVQSSTSYIEIERRIRPEPAKTILKIELRWNPEECRCELLADGQVLTPSRISQLALEDLFFMSDVLINLPGAP